MRVLFILLLVVFTSCSNPLDKVYEPISYRTDFRAIQDKDSLSAQNIAYVLERETPEVGATYQDILSLYPEVLAFQQYQDSIAKVEREERLRVLAERKRKREEKAKRDSIRQAKRLAQFHADEKARKIKEAKRRAEQRVVFIRVLDMWGVEDPHRTVAIEEFDNTYGYMNVSVSTAHINGDVLRVDVGPNIIEVYIN